jgi:hypothetical protein
MEYAIFTNLLVNIAVMGQNVEHLIILKTLRLAKLTDVKFLVPYTSFDTKCHIEYPISQFGQSRCLSIHQQSNLLIQSCKLFFAIEILKYCFKNSSEKPMVKFSLTPRGVLAHRLHTLTCSLIPPSA